MSLAQRSITSAIWNITANLTSMVVLFVRSVLLARLLPVEVFGVYAFANSVVRISAVVPAFGMGGAFLHRAPETEDEEQTAAVHFTLRLIFTMVWAFLLITGAFVFTSDQTRTALLLLTVTTGGMQLAHTPRVILARRVLHRRLALVQFLDALLTTLVALGLAWQGTTLWALLATDLISFMLIIVALYVWQPVWRPRLAWSSPLVRYFLRFGSRNFLASVLLRALNRIDDLWTGLYLGETSLGLYSRAYTFATYPSIILAVPINKVAEGTYAELKGERLRLSQAFFRTNALLVRSGFFLAGLLALVVPEFTRLALGTKWLPMVDAFRLMLVFTLLDPIKVTVGSLFVAVGKPEQVARVRLLQLAVLIGGLFLAGPHLGIAGVALAVDVMLVVGIAVLLWQARAYVDFSFRRLFAVPALALTVGLLLGRAAILLPGVAGSDWRTGSVKIAVFSVVYGTTLMALEHHQFFETLSFLISHVFGGVDSENSVVEESFRKQLEEKLVGHKYHSRQERAIHIKRHFHKYLAGRVLDVGSGGAGLCFYLDRCVSIDLNPATDPDVFVNLEKGNLPFISNSFDCVVCTDVLEHLENLHHIFAELVRVSRQYLIISLPNNWLGARAIICKGSHTRSMRRYGLPIERPFDRHRWFFSYTEAEDFVYGMATRMNLQVIRCEPYFGTRNQIRSALLRPWMSSRRLHNLFASALWVVLKVADE
jgi:O-antigen/teichoic acid export membrane protein/SAM-dependent methyltransferase